MTDETPRRQTPTERQHEALMAVLTKQPKNASSTTEVGEAAVGDKKGQLYLKSHVTVRGDDEDWPQYIGRVEQELADLSAALSKHNADTIRRHLEAVQS